ncbi:MAG TPA: zinc-dependent metalloprotease family protein, partial [Tepidisphaeraceae bacterium]|nr:zinc-dependent metalloprotease family protein [Tepidisphaeraceae bacterium]
MRYSFEILEARVLLSAVTIHVLDVTADPRFFAPVSSIAAKDGATVSAPANAYAPFKLHFNSLKAELSLAPREFTSSAKTPLVLRLPTPDGTLERFNVVDAPIMEAGLASEFPQVRTFRGVGIDDPSASVRLDYTPLGFHAQVLGSNGRYYIDPYYLNDVGGTYVSYYRRDLPLDAGTRAYDLDVGGKALDAPSTDVASQVTGDVSASLVTGTTLRTFRAAVAADGEYVGAAGGGTVVGGLSAVTTAMNRVVGVYETELAVRMVLVNAESSIIYTKAATDPYSNNSPSALLNQNQSNLDSVIGNANYDIGHVFSTGGGGLARLACVGQTGAKAQAETGLPNPTGDAFYIDYVAHEMGHQFGGNHTFNTSNDSGNRNGSTAYEPGSGSTIMAYAGIEGAEDLQPHSDPFFHAISLQEISTYLATIPGVGTSAATGNTPPTVSAGSNYTIPTGTPFALTATGSDPDGDPITFEWEEMDKGPATLLTTADNASSPLFRDWAPATSPTRTLPQLAGILSGTNQVLNASSRPVEKLYAAARTSNWRVIARDNRAGGGGVATSDMTLSVVNTGASFAVSTGNSSTTWTGGSSQTISWNVAGTTGSGINTANVKISLSSDGGNTFPTVLAASTPNDGSESLVIPNVGTTQARIKIEAVGNIFFDINN